MTVNGHHLDQMDTAKTLGSVVTSSLIQAAGALDALRSASAALHAENADQAKLVIDNFLTAFNGGVLDDLDGALNAAIPRSGEAVSYG